MCCISARKRKCRYSPPIAISPPLKLPRNTSRFRVAPEAYEELGTFAQMNPPIREGRHRAALWKALEQGIVDVIGSDHAPHTREEKADAYPHSPAGMPGVQTLLPLMLNHMADGKLSLAKLVFLTSYRARSLFNLANKGEVALGNHADLTFVDLAATAQSKKIGLPAVAVGRPLPENRCADGRSAQWYGANALCGTVYSKRRKPASPSLRHLFY